MLRVTCQKPWGEAENQVRSIPRNPAQDVGGPGQKVGAMKVERKTWIWDLLLKYSCWTAFGDCLDRGHKQEESKVIWRFDQTERIELLSPETGNIMEGIVGGGGVRAHFHLWLWLCKQVIRHNCIWCGGFPCAPVCCLIMWIGLS